MTSHALLDLTVSDVLLRVPGAAQVFVTRGMSCVGCPFAPFETVADVACLYAMDPTELATALLRADPHHPAEPRGLHV